MVGFLLDHDVGVCFFVVNVELNDLFLPVDVKLKWSSTQGKFNF